MSNQIDSKSIYNQFYSNISSAAAATAQSKSKLNPTSALPFMSSSSFGPFKPRQLTLNNNNNNSDKYTYIRNKPLAGLAQGPGSAAFLNRNKNPAYSFTNRNNNANNSNGTFNSSSTGNSLINLTSSKSGNAQLSTSKNNNNKSAILSHLNLNNKAKEELEKRKQKAKEVKEREAALISSNGNDEKEEPAKTVADNTPAIPITSYTSYDNEEDDDDDDEEEENEPKRDDLDLESTNQAPELTKLTKLSNGLASDMKLKAAKQLVKANCFNELDDDDDEDELNEAEAKKQQAKKTTAKPVTKVIKAPPVKKQPILKAGQTQKERDEIKLSFIGPKLPYKQLSSTTNLESADTAKLVEFDSKQQKFYLTTTSKAQNNEEKSAETTESAQASSSSSSTEPTNEAPINYSKDELAKYEDLLKMSQLYAKYNQVGVVNVGPTGLAEISMVELDNNNNNNQQAATAPSQITAETLQLSQIQIEQLNRNMNPFVVSYASEPGMSEEKAEKIIEDKQKAEQQQDSFNQAVVDNMNSLQAANELQQQVNGLEQSSQFSMQIFQNQQQQQQIINMQQQQQQYDAEQNRQIMIEKAVALQVSELEGLSVPHDVTLINGNNNANNMNKSISPINEIQEQNVLVSSAAQSISDFQNEMILSSQQQQAWVII